MRHSLDITSQRLDHLTSHIRTLHPHRPLRLGYAIVERNGSPLTAKDKMKNGDEVTLLRYRDTSTATITATEKIDRKDNGQEKG